MGEFDDIFGNIGDADRDGNDIGNIREAVEEGRKIVKKSQDHVIKFIMEHSMDDPLDGLSTMVDASLSFALLNKFLDAFEQVADKVENAPKKRAEMIEKANAKAEKDVDAFLDFLNAHPEIKELGQVNNEAAKWFGEENRDE